MYLLIIHFVLDAGTKNKFSAIHFRRMARVYSLHSLEMVYEITIGVSFSLHYLAGQAVNEMLFGISNLIAVDK